MIGFDCGTYNLVCCKRDKDKKLNYLREVNAFLEMPLENRFVFNMMKNAGVKLIERKDQNIAYALGESATDIAYTMSELELRRPMKGGCINPKEKNAQQILGVMIHSLIGNLSHDKEILYYSIPANAVNEDTDADYHNSVLAAIFKAYRDDNGYTLDARPINEALAVVYSEAANNAYTAIVADYGCGMANICMAVYGVPIFQFSVVNSGDWIDKMAAKATGESIAYINKEKTKVDLLTESDSLVHRAIKAQYEIMIQKSITEIKQGIEKVGKKAHVDKPINCIVAGGTTLPNGFTELFEKNIRQANLSIDIGKIVRPVEPLYSVAAGCLIAAETASD